MTGNKRAYYERLSKEDLIKVLLRRDDQLKQHGYQSGSLVDSVGALLKLKEHDPIVYLIQWGDRYKIGTTKCIRDRVSGLSLPRESVISAIWGGREQEKRLHERFSKYRIGKSEWFYYSEDLFKSFGVVSGSSGTITEHNVITAIRGIFDELDVDFIRSPDLVTALKSEFNLSMKSLASLLSRKGFKSTRRYWNGHQSRGYLRSDFEEVRD